MTNNNAGEWIINFAFYRILRSCPVDYEYAAGIEKQIILGEPTRVENDDNNKNYYTFFKQRRR